MLWVDKYRPVQLDRLSFHDDLTSQLRRMASKESGGNMSHLMFYGPSGAGKKTRVMALLREVGQVKSPIIMFLTGMILCLITDLWTGCREDACGSQGIQIQVIICGAHVH